MILGNKIWVFQEGGGRGGARIIFERDTSYNFDQTSPTKPVQLYVSRSQWYSICRLLESVKKIIQFYFYFILFLFLRKWKRETKDKVQSKKKPKYYFFFFFLELFFKYSPCKLIWWSLNGSVVKFSKCLRLIRPLSCSSYRVYINTSLKSCRHCSIPGAVCCKLVGVNAGLVQQWLDPVLYRLWRHILVRFNYCNEEFFIIFRFQWPCVFKVFFDCCCFT